MKIYLTRHGQTEWNVQKRMQGQLNSDLTELGEHQARCLGERLRDTNIDVICSSSSGRTVQTAELIRGDRDIPIETYDELREIYLGEWEGMSHDEAMILDPIDRHKFWHEPEKFNSKGKETFGDVVVRAKQALEMLIKKHEGKTILIVSHACLLKGAFVTIKNLALKDYWSGEFMNPTNLSLVHYEKNQYNIEFEGDISHHKEMNI